MHDQRFSSTTQGLILIIVGTILLFYVLGFLQAGLTAILTLCALAMIAYGFIKADGYQFVTGLVKKTKKMDFKDHTKSHHEKK